MLHESILSLHWVRFVTAHFVMPLFGSLLENFDMKTWEQGREAGTCGLENTLKERHSVICFEVWMVNRSYVWKHMGKRVAVKSNRRECDRENPLEKRTAFFLLKIQTSERRKKKNKKSQKVCWLKRKRCPDVRPFKSHLEKISSPIHPNGIFSTSLISSQKL